MQLAEEQLRDLIKNKELITDYIDLERQLTPNGFDMTVSTIKEIQGNGQLDFTNEERVIPPAEPVETSDGWWDLSPGIYKATTNEIVNIPDHLVGIGFPRSSLMRMGAHIQNGFWEAGYHGETTFLLCVDNPEGIRIKQDARVLQLSFHQLTASTTGYDGTYSF